MSNIENFKKWVRKDLYPITGLIVIEQETSDVVRLFLYTATNRYNIVAKEIEEYLGCTSSSRKSRPGEDWNRGNDLPDGKLSKKTWHRILCGIVRYEMQYISSDADVARLSVESESCDVTESVAA